MLFHNAALHTPEALPAILTCLINDGYTVLPISQLILPPPYTIDHTGRQFPAEQVAGSLCAVNYVNQKYTCLYTFRRASSSFM